jgi:hypothetical protein
MIAVVLMLMMFRTDMFVVEAAAEASYDVEVNREALRGYVDDIGLFARNMPGVIEVRPLGDSTYLYRTERDIPLSGSMQTDFVIRKRMEADSVTTYESVDRNDDNYMLCRVVIRPLTPTSTNIRIQLRLQLSRERASEVHWLAPILGADFISEQMRKDLVTMLDTFIERSNEELYTHLNPAAANR